MHVFFEDSGQLRTGTILSEQPASLQVELPTGRRLKVRGDRVLLRFMQPAPAEALKEAQAQTLDLDFLWAVCPDDEFSCEDLARDYFGGDPSSVQQITMALTLFSAPIYFHKKGRGRYKKAPEDILNAARASLARKAQEATQVEAWCAELQNHVMPKALQQKLPMLLYKPDKNSLEYKAFQAVCEMLKISPVKLAERCGMIPSSHEYHFNHFLTNVFPNGAAFPDWEMPDFIKINNSLPLVNACAFSIDDRTTTEFDDAFSVKYFDNGHAEIGIHIAAPALAITHGSELDAIARSRLSTVYMPGRKITMLPDEVIDVFTLKAGNTPPVLSLYVEIDNTGAPVTQRTELERITIAANLCYEDIVDDFTDAETAKLSELSQAMHTLWRFVQHHSALRGKTEIERTEFSFYVDWNAAPEGLITIMPRRRGSPLDRLIAECAIFVNNQWGQLLANHQAAGLYRTQKQNRVRISTRPGEHQGLGVSHYLWATSPIRRYSDMVNQQQLLAVLHQEKPPFEANDGALLAVLSDFEATYRQYAEFQKGMERYWCLRWLLQEKTEAAEAVTTRRANTVRLTQIPLFVTLADLPGNLSPGRAIQVSLNNIDLLFLSVEAHFLGTLAQPTNISFAEDEEFGDDNDGISKTPEEGEIKESQ